MELAQRKSRSSLMVKPYNNALKSDAIDSASVAHGCAILSCPFRSVDLSITIGVRFQ